MIKGDLNIFIISFLQALPSWLITLVISAMPIIELRGSVPIAINILKMPIMPAILISILGNLLPILPILLALELLTKIAKKSEKMACFLEWIFARTRKKGKQIENYEFLGLILFVAIPIPGTGVWTGTMAAFLFGLSKLKTFLACFIGVCIASLIMLVFSLGINTIFI